MTKRARPIPSPPLRTSFPSLQGKSGGGGHRRERGGRDHLRVDGVLPVLREHAAERPQRPRQVSGKGRRHAAGQNAPVYPGLCWLDMLRRVVVVLCVLFALACLRDRQGARWCVDGITPWQGACWLFARVVLHRRVLYRPVPLFPERRRPSPR